MKTALRCLCLSAVAIICETFTVCQEEFKKLQIAEPNGCEISTIINFRFGYSMTCPGFSMEMATYFITEDETSNPSLQLNQELRSTVKCSNNSPPYKYLLLTDSKRNSLTLENCPPPENGSFGEGWPNLEIFKFESYGNIEPLIRQHFSGLNNVWFLVLNINSSHYMADDIFSDMTNLTGIRLSVEQINKNIFRNLNKLEQLAITIKSRDDLDNFDMGEMKNLPSFKTLELSFSSFRRLTKRFFKGCPHIETLIINFNEIDAIDGNAFESLTNLKHVSMLANKLTWLPEGLFSKNVKLETIYISSRYDTPGITSLPSGFFSNLPNLRKITFNCKLTSIPADLIRVSTNLELLDLQFNRLRSMPRALLENHSKLRKIELYGNEFGDRPSENLFNNKSELTEIRFEE